MKHLRLRWNPSPPSGSDTFPPSPLIFTSALPIVSPVWDLFLLHLLSIIHRSELFLSFCQAIIPITFTFCCGWNNDAAVAIFYLFFCREKEKPIMQSEQSPLILEQNKLTSILVQSLLPVCNKTKVYLKLLFHLLKKKLSWSFSNRCIT